MTRPSFVLSTRNQNVPAVHKNNQGDVGLVRPSKNFSKREI
ncbi:hypothetical protein M7I_8200 [Glarea lozoyensis 74030]|uniref:Uncharacterized protein n=1 Tax=Glarea lozoyensis (strain ATCC 74030 / MF5533) TaxID=1104152 RepID=H0EZD5_GLAL7|nr:hypothetical protein M7I_8200 [Glarea lozoyensis 74030]